MANSALENFCDALGNVVLKDADGNPSIFVRYPKQSSKDFDASLPDHPHPAFVVNNVTDPAVLIGKYKAVEKVANGTLYSLPNMPPRNNMGMDTIMTRMQQFGGDVTGITIADHGLMVLKAHKLGIITHGNNNYGADYRSGSRFELAKVVTAGQVLVFRGWKYTCLKDHTTSNELLPTDAPAYWMRGRQVGGTPIPSQAMEGSTYNTYNTLTGSGPIDWYFNDDVADVCEVSGNVAENVKGFRLVNCEIQILPDNNAADPAADVSATSSAWRAIKPHANDDGFDYVAPGTAGTVHYNWLNSKITLDTVEPNFDNAQRNTPFKNVAVNTEHLPHVPYILYELGLCPLPGTTVDGYLYIHFTRDERVARRGGYYNCTGNAGVAYLNCYGIRSSLHMTYGARPRSRQKT